MRKKHILLIDDHKIFCEIFSAFFAEKFIIHTAHDAETGLSVFKASPEIDLLIVDYGLPQMSGVDLVCCIRESHPAIPIIGISGDAHCDAAFLNAGATHFSEKALDAQILEHLIVHTFELSQMIGA